MTNEETRRIIISWSTFPFVTMAICTARRHTVRRNRSSRPMPRPTIRAKANRFSPTDLVATALGTCITTTMGIKADSLGVDLRGMTVSVKKEMSKDSPRRIVGLPSEVHIPLPANSPHREILEQTALNCPVHKSLPPKQSIARRNFSGKASGWQDSGQLAGGVVFLIVRAPRRISAVRRLSHRFRRGTSESKVRACPM